MHAYAGKGSCVSSSDVQCIGIGVDMKVPERQCRLLHPWRPVFLLQQDTSRLYDWPGVRITVQLPACRQINKIHGGPSLALHHTHCSVAAPTVTQRANMHCAAVLTPIPLGFTAQANITNCSYLGNKAAGGAGIAMHGSSKVRAAASSALLVSCMHTALVSKPGGPPLSLCRKQACHL